MSYNGWANYQTWNIALWLGNDEGLYHLAREHKDYASISESLREMGLLETPDHVAFNDSGLDEKALDDFLQEL
jgi:hypothetical protein